jgi:hypothetical protein
MFFFNSEYIFQKSYLKFYKSFTHVFHIQMYFCKKGLVTSINRDVPAYLPLCSSVRPSDHSSNLTPVISPSICTQTHVYVLHMCIMYVTSILFEFHKSKGFVDSKRTRIKFI